MKIAVYAIAKNEEKHVKRWLDSAVDADHILLLDTGCTDRTAPIALNYEMPAGRNGALAVRHKEFSPWRFDVARNYALSLLPGDIDLCITLDLDEVLVPGWRQKIEGVWLPLATRLKYGYVWNWTADGKPNIQFQADRSHARHGYAWRGAVHESVSPPPGATEYIVTVPDVLIHHHADDSKTRSQYLPLLELSVQENPNDDRASHYLGREYMYQGEHDRAITELNRHLALPSAKWREERAASYRYLGRCYEEKQMPGAAQAAYMKACMETPQWRDCWHDMAKFFDRHKNYPWARIAILEAVRQTARPNHYLVNPDAWGADIHELAANICFWAGDLDTGREQWKIAHAMEPDNIRITNNGEFFK